MISKENIAKMKDGVRIINCARGGLINEEDLAEALTTGKVAGAAIDVFEEEPCTDSPLHGLGDKVILTPHLGASTTQAQLNVAIDVSEQIRDVLSGGVAKSAVNLPGLKPDLVKQIKHYLGLSEYMGSMLRQLTNGVIQEIEIEALGELAEKNIEGLKLAVLKGILSCNLDSVTFVNAPIIAKERGIKVKELKSDDSGAYIDKLRIKLVTENNTRVIAGTVLQQNIPAIIQIDSFPVNIRPENHSIVTFHQDKPGIVAQVSKILWDNQVNISSLNLGRTQDSSALYHHSRYDGIVYEDCVQLSVLGCQYRIRGSALDYVHHSKRIPFAIQDSGYFRLKTWYGSVPSERSQIAQTRLQAFLRYTVSPLAFRTLQSLNAPPHASPCT